MFHLNILKLDDFDDQRSTEFFSALEASEIAIVSIENITKIDIVALRTELERLVNRIYVENMRQGRNHSLAFVVRVLPHQYTNAALNRFINKILFSDVPFRRYQKSELLLLQCNEELQLQRIDKEKKELGILLTGEALKCLREIELTTLIKDAGCILEAPKNSSFRLMAKVLGKQFFRVGNFQRSAQNLFAFYFWFRPIVSDFSHLIADTWTISTFLQFVQFQERVKFKRDLHIGYLQSHILDDETKARSVVEILLKNGFKSNDRLLLVWSAVSSGKSVEKMLQLLGLSYKSVLEVTETIVLLSKKDERSLNFLLRNPDANSFPNYVSSGFENSDRLIDIDPKGFYPATHSRQQKKLVLKTSSADKQFFEKYAGKSIFSVHRDGRNGSHVHHAFHVDFEKLVDTEAFQKKLAASLDDFDLSLVDLILSPEKPNNIKFVDLICKKAGTLETFFIPLDDLRSREQPLLRGKLTNLTRADGSVPRVLFVESVAIKGKDVSCFTHAWRAVPSNFKVGHLIGLLRSSSAAIGNKKLKLLRTPYGQLSESTAIAIEEVVLPTWGKEDCPWCKELILLQRLERTNIEDAGLLKHIKWRRAILDDHSGNRDKLLHGAEDISDLKAFDRSAASKFFNTASTTETGYSDADWLLSVASIFQRWRTEPDETCDFVIDPETVVDDNMFSDPFLRAAIFRCLNSEEITHQIGEDRRKFIDFVSQDLNLKDPDSRFFYLGREAVLAFGELFQNLTLNEHLDLVGETLCKAKLGRT